MEFLVEFTIRVPEGTPAAEIESRQEAEAASAAALAREGHIARVWIPPVAPGQTKALGLYRADDRQQLDGLLGDLPLSDWMDIVVTPLQPHPNDPGA